MAAQVESIQLDINPKVRSSGLRDMDRAIEQLEKLQKLQNTTIHVNVIGNLKGLRKMTEDVEGSMEKSMSRVNKMQEAQVAKIRTMMKDLSPGTEQKIKWDFKQPKQALEAIKKQIEEIRRTAIKFENHGSYTSAAEARSLANDAAKALTKIEKVMEQMDAAPAHSEKDSAGKAALHTAIDTKLISDAEILTEYRKHGFGKLEGPDKSPIDFKEIEQLKTVLDRRLVELNQSITQGSRMMAQGKATLTGSAIKYKTDPKTGQLVPVKQTSEAITGAGERMKMTRTNDPAGSTLDLKVNESVRAMAEAMKKLPPELQKAAKSLAASLSIEEARARGVTKQHQSALFNAGALRSTDITQGFREAAGFALPGVQASEPGAMKPAVTQTNAFAAAEKNLTEQAKGSVAALSNQDAILQQKLRSLSSAAMGAKDFARAEQEIGDQSKVTAAATASSAKAEERLLTQRWKNGKLVQKTFVDAGGITRKMDLSKDSPIETRDFNRMTEASLKVRKIKDEFEELIKTQKAGGASASQLAATYQKYGIQLDKIAKSYADIDQLTSLGISRQAQRAQKEGERTVLKDNRKKEAESISAEQSLQRQRSAALIKAQKDQQAQMEKAAKEKEAVLKKQHTDYYARARRENDLMQERLAAEKMLVKLNTSGYQEHSRSSRTSSKGRMMETINYARETKDARESMKVLVERDRAGRILNATTTETTRVMKDAGHAAGDSAKNFLNNSLTVAAWATSVGALYGALNMVSHGFESAKEIERKTATLGQVFRGTKEDSLALRDGVLQLGVAYNRSSDEALDAAIRFSRLGLTKAEVLEAVAVSLQAANVAEIDTATAAEQLSSIFAAYNLNVGQLRTTLGQLNAISNTYNTTNKDLLAGIARVAPLARQAGLSLSELMGLIGAGVGRTGRPGAEFGNAIKSIIASLTNPAEQKKLKKGFDFDVTDQTGQMKDFSTVLQDLFVKYQQLNGAERQSLANTVGKKMQASRLTALLDGYVQAQVLAIRANRNLSSAEKENEAIRDTLSSQLQGLITQYESFSAVLLKSSVSGGVTSFLKELVQLMKNLLGLLTAGGDVTAYFAAGMTALALSTILYVTASNKAGAASNFLLNTLIQARVAAVGLAEGFMTMTSGAGRAILGIVGLTRAVQGLGAAALLVETLTGMIAIVAAVAVVTWGAEKAMHAVNAVMADTADEAEKANAKLAGFNDELERLRALAKAEGDVAKLADTISKAIQSPNANVKDVKEWLKLMEEVGGLAKGELLSLYQRGDRVQLNNRLEEIGLESQKRKAGYAMDEAKSTRFMLADAKERSRLAEKDLEKQGKDPLMDENFKNLQNRIRELQGGATDIQIISEDEQEEISHANDALEKQKELLSQKLEMIEKIYGALSKGNEANRVDDEIQAEKAKLALLDLQNARYQQRLALVRGAVFDNNAGFSKKDQFLEVQEKMAALREKADMAMYRNDEKRKNGQISSAQKSFETMGRAQGDFGGSGIDLLNLAPTVDDAQMAIDALTEMSELRRQNVDLLAQGNEWQKRNAELQSEETSFLQGKESVQMEANDAAREEIQLQLEKLQNEKAFLALKLDAIEAGKRDAAIATSGSRVGDSQAAQDLNELKSFMKGGGPKNGLTGIMGIEDAKKELDALQTKIEDKLVRAQSVDPRDEIRSLQLLEQLRASGVRMEELRLNAVTRLHAIEADITNEKVKQQQEASKNLLLASREEQLRAAAAARFAQSRGGKGFSAQEFQFLDQNTRQGIVQNNPNLAPAELQGKTKELEAERQILVDFFSKTSDGMQSFNDAVRLKADELKAIQILPSVAGGEGAPDLDSQIAKAGGAVVSAVDAMGKTVVDTLDKMELSLGKITSRLEGRISVLEIGFGRAGDPAGVAQSGVRTLGG